MEKMYPAHETLGSTVLLTNKTTISNKLLTLASPKPRRSWICRHVKVAVPSVGIIWYLPISWLVHSYLEMTCIREMDLIRPSHLISVVQVLIALSVAVLVIFTVSAVLRVGQHSDVLSADDTFPKRPSMKHLLQVVRSQMYHLQALSAFILFNSYLLLQTSQVAYDFLGEVSENGTVSKGKNRLETNSSDTVLSLLSLPENRLTYVAFCGNAVIPLTIYAIQESELLWQKKKLWGFLYSFILLLSPLKYLCSSLSFYVISVIAHKSPQNLLFQSVSKWLLSLYITSSLSLFFFTFALKIYIELIFKTPALSSGSITLRKKTYSCPSPLGVILTSGLIVGCEIPYVLHFINFIVYGISEILIVCLLVFSTGFCLITIAASLVVGFKGNYNANKSRIKKKRLDSGVCLANSFVYQARSDAGKTKY